MDLNRIRKIGCFVSAALSLSTGPVFAEGQLGLFCCQPERGWQLRAYAGVDAQSRNMKYVNGYGSNIFKRSYPQGNVFVGLRIHDYLGIEAGYETTPMRTSTASVGQNDLILGLSSSSTEVHLTKAKIKGWHTGVMGFLPVCDIFCNPMELLGYVGQVKMKTFNQDLFAMEGGVPHNILATKRTFVKRKSLLKLGLGVQYTFCTSGVRFMVGYENTKKLAGIHPLEQPSNQRLSFKNSLLWSMGAFITMP